MAARETGRRRAGTTGAKLSLTAAAVAGTLGGWAAFGMAEPMVAANTMAAPTPAATATPSTPALGTAPSNEGATPAGGRRGRRGTFTQRTAPGPEGTAPSQVQPQEPSTDQQAPTTQLPQARSRSSR